MTTMTMSSAAVPSPPPPPSLLAKNTTKNAILSNAKYKDKDGDALSPFVVERAEAKDAREILEFLFSDFLHNEPLNAAVELSREECANFFTELVGMSFDDGLSFVVRDPAENGKMIAVRLANIVRRTRKESTVNGSEEKNGMVKKGGTKLRKMSNGGHAFCEERPENEKVRHISGILHIVESKIWSLVPQEIDTLLYWLIISVDAKYQRRGIAKALLLHRLDEAVNDGCQGMVTEASAFNSQRLFEKLGYKRLFELKHVDFKDKNGKQIFRCKDGTDRVTLEFKCID